MEASFIENPIFLGLIASGIVWCGQRLSRRLGNMSVVWLTGAAALILAVSNEVVVMSASNYEVQAMAKEFDDFTRAIFPVAQQLLSRAVPIFLSAQIIHESLQSKLAEKVIYGTAKVLRRSVDGYEYLAEIVTGGNNGDKTRGT